jgi:hypothetical protein
VPTSLLVAALLASLDPAASSPVAAEPCAAVEALPEVPACATPLCAARERVRTVCELRAALEARYVFLDAKRTLLGPGVDPRARLSACAASERAIAREDEPLAFYDRVRRCLAGLDDGHLLVSSPARLPQVALGLGFRRAGGKVVVAWRDAALRQLAGDAVAAALPVGAEVVALDGRPIGDVLADLGRAIPASSPGARLVRAVEALARRDFAHPRRRTAEVTVASGEGRRTVEVPWWVSPGAERHPIAGTWARAAGIPSTDLLPWFEDAARPRPGAGVEGAPAWAPLFEGGAALREYSDASGRVALRAGTAEHGGRAICYLQILTFHTEWLSGPGGRRPFAEVVEEQVGACAAQRLDLVLDLRRNEGGYLDHSTAVAEALAPAGAAQPGAALILRATERNEAVYRERAGAASAAASGPLRVLDAIGAARREGRPFTPAFVGDPLVPRSSVGGYSGRVVALTGPGCMSACDRLVALLRASGRATLVGGPTEGAGGSQQESPGVGAKWTDSERLLSVSIPNAAFGVRRSAAGAVVVAVGSSAPAAADAPRAELGAPAAPRAREVSFETFFDAYAIENRPVEPDVRYETQLEDVTQRGRGWREQIDAALAGDAHARRDRV